MTLNRERLGKKAIHFGPGNIGRGFVACFLHNSGFEVIFVGRNGSLVNQLNAQPSYKVTEVGAKGTSECTIANYRALNSKTEEFEVIDEISTADVVTCSVGPNNLKSIAPIIAKGIDRRPRDLPPAAVIACENAIGATHMLAEYIKQPQNMPPERATTIGDRATFANSAIDRIVPAQDPNAGLNVTIEKFFEWVVDNCDKKQWL